ncbi:hypothetical protein BAURA86_04146, partial [Brevibacterium aurantiacum]
MPSFKYSNENDERPRDVPGAFFAASPSSVSTASQRRTGSPQTQLP